MALIWLYYLGEAKFKYAAALVLELFTLNLGQDDTLSTVGCEVDI